MLKKPVWIVLKILELLLTLACCWVLWRCCPNHKHSQILMLSGFYGFATVMSLGLLLATIFIKEILIRFEAEQAFLLGILHMAAIYMHLNTANKELCTTSILVALWISALYLMHCNLALNQMFSNGHGYMNEPLMMPPFNFRRADGSQVYICEPLPSLTHGPMGLPPMMLYEEI